MRDEDAEETEEGLKTEAEPGSFTEVKVRETPGGRERYTINPSRRSIIEMSSRKQEEKHQVS